MKLSDLAPRLPFGNLGLNNDDFAVSSLIGGQSREKTLRINRPGSALPLDSSSGLQPHSYGDLMDLLLRVPPGPERLACMQRAVEVLAGREPSCIIAGARLTHEPGRMRGLDADMLRASRASIQFVYWAMAGLRMERPRGSKWHEPAEVAMHGKLAVCGYGVQDASRPRRGEETGPITPSGVFLIEHDWSAALRADEGGEVLWPYAMFVLEFRLSGRRVCALMIDPTKLDADLSVIASGVRANVPYMLLFVETMYEGWALPCTFDWVGGRWTRYGATRHPIEAEAEDALLAVVAPQLRALCIVLDAEVVEREVIRAPQKLNHAREKRGHLPLSDHTVLNLARRYRADRSPDRADEERRRSPRLHWRRGHWRHYDSRRVWIKWQLVGDPDLGFVDKEYRV